MCSLAITVKRSGLYLWEKKLINLTSRLIQVEGAIDQSNENCAWLGSDSARRVSPWVYSPVAEHESRLCSLCHSSVLTKLEGRDRIKHRTITRPLCKLSYEYVAPNTAQNY